MHICTNIFYFLLLALDNTKGTLVVREEVDKPGSLCFLLIIVWFGANSKTSKPLFVVVQTVSCVYSQASLSIVFPRQEHGSGLPFPSSGDLPDPGIEPVSPTLACRFVTAEPPGKQASFSSSLKMWLISPLAFTHIYCGKKDDINGLHFLVVSIIVSLVPSTSLLHSRY